MAAQRPTHSVREANRVTKCEIFNFVYTFLFFFFMPYILEGIVEDSSFSISWALFFGYFFGIYAGVFRYQQSAYPEDNNATNFSKITYRFRQCAVNFKWYLTSGLLIMGYGACHYLPRGYSLVTYQAGSFEKPELNREPLAAFYFLMLLVTLHPFYFGQYAEININPFRPSKLLHITAGVLVTVSFACGVSFFLTAISYTYVFQFVNIFIKEVSFVSRMTFELRLVLALFSNGVLLSLYWMSIFFGNYDILYQAPISNEPDSEDIALPRAADTTARQSDSTFQRGSMYPDTRVRRGTLRVVRLAPHYEAAGSLQLVEDLSVITSTSLLNISPLTDPTVEGNVYVQTNLRYPTWEHNVRNLTRS